MKQKVLALSLAFCMALSLSPVGVLAKQAPTKTGGDISVSQGSEGTPAQGDPASSTPASSDPASSTPAPQAAQAGAPPAPATKLISAFAEPAIIVIEIGDTRTEQEIIASFPSAVLATVDGAENTAVPVGAWARVFPSADTAYASDAQGEFFYEPSIDNSVYTLSPEATLPNQTVQVGAALSHAPQLANTLSGVKVGPGGSAINLEYGLYYPVANGALGTAQATAPASGGYLRIEGTTLHMHNAALSAAGISITVPDTLPNLSVILSGTNSLSGAFNALNTNLRVAAAEESASLAVNTGILATTYTQESGSVSAQNSGEAALSATTSITLNGGTLTAKATNSAPAFSVAPSLAQGASFAIFAGEDEASASEVDPATQLAYYTDPYVKITTASTYDVWVADVQVTAANKNDILSGLNLTGTVSFDPTTSTLTLNGVDIEDKSYTNGFIHTTLETLNIEIEGENSIQLHGASGKSVISGKNLRLTGAESATLNVVSKNFGTGIHAEGDFTQNGGTLTATGSYGGVGIIVTGNFTQNGGTLTATGGMGIHVTGNFTQNSGTLTVAGGGGGAGSSGAGSGAGSSLGHGGSGGSGGTGLNVTGSFTQNGGTLTATGGSGGSGDGGGDGYNGGNGGSGGVGVEAGNFTQSGGTLTATGGNGGSGGSGGGFGQVGSSSAGGNGGNGGNGIVSGNFTQSGGTLTATGGTGGRSGAGGGIGISDTPGQNGIALYGSYVTGPSTVLAGESETTATMIPLAALNQGGSGFLTSKGYRYIKMQGGGSYKVSIGGLGLNVGGIYSSADVPFLESGTITIAPDGTVILNNATVTAPLASEGSLSLELNGSNTFAPTGGAPAIEAGGSVSILGGTNSNAAIASGIFAGEDIYISGANAAVAGQMTAGSNISLFNSQFSATSTGTPLVAQNLQLQGGSLEVVSTNGAPAVEATISAFGFAQISFQNNQANRAVFSHGVQKNQTLPLASAVQGRVFKEAPSAATSASFGEMQSIDHQNSAYLRVETSYFKLAETPVQEGASLAGLPLTNSELAPLQTWAQGRGGRVLLAQNLFHSDANANALTPSAPVPLQMQVVGANAGETLVGLHVTNSGEIQQIPITVQSTQDGITQASMNAATFSIYAVVALPSESASTSGAGATTMLSPQTGAA